VDDGNIFCGFNRIASHTFHLGWWFYVRVDEGNNDGKDSTGGVALCDKCCSLTVHPTRFVTGDTASDFTGTFSVCLAVFN